MLVSIIIPAYNVEAYVGEALDSALAQTYRPIEIIAVDNNSTDGTLGVLQQYQMLHPKLITVLQEPKQGAPAARNLGLKHAKGEWLQFLDADDILLPEKIERQVGLVIQDANRALVVGGARVENRKGGAKIVTPENLPFPILLSTGFAGVTSSNLWRRKSILEIGGWNESIPFIQEYDLMKRLLYWGLSLVQIDIDEACKVRFRKDSISNSKLELYDMYSALFHIELALYLFNEQRALFNEYDDRVIERFKFKLFQLSRVDYNIAVEKLASLNADFKRHIRKQPNRINLITFLNCLLSLENAILVYSKYHSMKKRLI